MRDKSKQLLVINTGKKQSEQTGMPSQSGTTHIIGGGGLSVNMSDYLLKSIWDKVFEIRTDSQGTEYIFGKLPMVTQYGITMYSGDGVDIPSLASGLPFDGRTIWYNPDTNQIEVIGGTGGGSGEGVSNFWDLSGIPSWITNSKPKYTYSEIEGTPDLTKYALVSQIPSLSGYATELWVTKQNYATKATTLSGYGITDAYTKTNVDDLLKSYVTLGGTPQTITGEKNFTGGLKVNGSPIYYDTEKKYWKLEGDLLVTGGVTMYGSDSSFTPSTIMDAIAVDGTTISKSGGVLKVIGGAGGGVADSVAWENITDKPTWIGSSKPTYSYSEITGAISTTELQNYLTQNSYLNVTSGDNRYLQLSGGTISGTYGALTIHRTNENSSLIKYSNTSGVLGYLGFNSSNEPFVYKGTNTTTSYKIWHEGNDGEDSGLNADLLDGKQPSELNVGSATKLQTARTIWGQSFDGTGNVDGTFTVTSNENLPIRIHSYYSSSWVSAILATNTSLVAGQHFTINVGYGNSAYNNAWFGYYHAGVGSTSNRLSMGLQSVDDVINILGTGNVGIGTTNPSYKLHVIGDIGNENVRLRYSTSNPFLSLVRSTSSETWYVQAVSGYLAIGRTSSASCKIDASGNFLSPAGITMYSDQRKKTILNHVELSLKDIANAPLIEHYYNSDDKKTTHVGSIAQYWASINDWFCKLDSEGYYTMEIQNAALASAISIARELDRYETKTDKAIKKLKKRICELEEEIERLKSV